MQVGTLSGETPWFVERISGEVRSRRRFLCDGCGWLAGCGKASHAYLAPFVPASYERCLGDTLAHHEVPGPGSIGRVYTG